MRKTIFTALVTLLVMLAVSCDNGLGANKLDDGMVTLSIRSDGPIDLPDVVTTGVTNNLPANVPTGISRSLTTANAQAKKAYVEVIFKSKDSTPLYYRAAGPYKVVTGGIDLKVKVKKDTGYNALILIGSDDGTLLATGQPKGTVDVSDDTTVTFYVNALKSNISPVTVTTGSVDPDFVIDTNGNWGSSVATIATNKFNNGPNDFKPCFLAPASSASGKDIKATLTIHGFGTFTADSVSFSGTGPAIFVKTAPTVTFTPVGSAPAITPSLITPAASSAIGTTGKIEFSFATTTAGQYEITFKIPVVGFATDVPGGLTWNIRGGTASALDFTGTGFEDAIALLVTDEDPDYSTISIGTPSWQP